MKSLQSTSVKGGYVTTDTSKKPLLLEAGDYYVSMELSNAKKAGEGYYSVLLDESEYDTEFFTKADNSDDWTDMKTEGDYGLVGAAGEITGTGLVRADWVGYGDAVDYFRFTLSKNTSLSFSVYADDATKFTVWRLDGKTNKAGVTTYSLKSLATVKLLDYGTAQTKELSLAAGTYYFSMESTNAKKGGNAAYSVNVESFVASDSLSAALTMPEADRLAMTDGLSFDGYDTDALADASAASLTELDDKAVWQNMLA